MSKAKSSSFRRQTNKVKATSSSTPPKPASGGAVPPEDQRSAEAQLLSTFIRMAAPGLAVAIFLVVCTVLSDAPGLKEAVHELWKHAWAIHPLLYAALGIVVALSVAVQGGDISKRLDPWFSLPVLEFSAHLFSVATAALLPLALVSKTAWAYNSCSRWLGLSTLFMLLWAVSLVAVGALLIVRARVHALQKPFGKPPLKATEWQLWFFVAMGGLAIWGAFHFAQMGGASEDVVADILRNFTGGVCGMRP